MQLYLNKVTVGKDWTFESPSPQTVSPVGSSFVKKMCLLCFTFLVVNCAYAQKLLKITHMRTVTWDSYNRVWSAWPTTWTSFTAGNEPLITLYRLDDNGYKFRVDMFVNNQEFTFDVTYNGFDAKNNWSKYKDENGDEIMIAGSTMSNLSLYGWPDTTVDFYLWIYSKGMGFEME